MLIIEEFCKEGQRRVLIKTLSLPRLHTVGMISVKLELGTAEGIRRSRGNTLRVSADYGLGTVDVSTVMEV